MQAIMKNVKLFLEMCKLERHTGWSLMRAVTGEARILRTGM